MVWSVLAWLLVSLTLVSWLMAAGRAVTDRRMFYMNRQAWVHIYMRGLVTRTLFVVLALALALAASGVPSFTSANLRRVLYAGLLIVGSIVILLKRRAHLQRKREPITPDISLEMAQNKLAEALAEVEQYRAAARSDPGLQPRYAISLTALASCLVDNGLPEDALEPAKEAVHIFGQSADPSGLFDAAWADALEVLGVAHARLGHRVRAEAPLDHALHIRYKLAKRDNISDQVALARTLRVFGVCLAELGHRFEAVIKLSEAVLLGQEVVKKGVQAHAPELAIAEQELFKLRYKFPGLARTD